jgi:hypothetical protein
MLLAGYGGLWYETLLAAVDEAHEQHPPKAPIEISNQARVNLEESCKVITCKTFMLVEDFPLLIMSIFLKGGDLAS